MTENKRIIYIGGYGNDLIIAYNTHEADAAANEVDRLFGNDGCDTFAIDSAYRGAGYAFIGDFNPWQDKLKLTPGNYWFKQSGASTGIYTETDNLIVFLNGVGLGNGVITTQTWVTFQ